MICYLYQWYNDFITFPSEIEIQFSLIGSLIRPPGFIPWISKWCMHQCCSSQMLMLLEALVKNSKSYFGRCENWQSLPTMAVLVGGLFLLVIASLSTNLCAYRAETQFMKTFLLIGTEGGGQWDNHQSNQNIRYSLKEVKNLIDTESKLQ